jgi:hypothetical protein
MGPYAKAPLDSLGNPLKAFTLKFVFILGPKLTLSGSDPGKRE